MASFLALLPWPRRRGGGTAQCFAIRRGNACPLPGAPRRPCLPAEWAAVLEEALQRCLDLSPEDDLVLALLREVLGELLTLLNAVASTLYLALPS